MSAVRFGRCVLPVDDEDRAVAFYVDGLGFEVLVDERRPGGLRLVHVGSQGVSGPGIWLLRGRSSHSGPAAVLYADDLDAALERALANGGRLDSGPEEEPGSRFAHLLDPAGNELILAELT